MTSEIKRRFTDTEMQTARETDLPELLTHLGYQVKRIGRYYTTAEMDSLRIKDRRTWFRYSQGIGGDAITFLQHFCNQSFPEAVEYLLTFQGRPRDAPVKTKPVTKQDKPPKEFALPPRNADDRRVFAYLRKRGIAAQVIRQFMNSGSLYEDAVHHNCVFVGRDHTGQAKYAGLRGTYDRDGKGFRGDVTGSDKHVGFALPYDRSSDQVFIFEAPIDLMSHASIAADFYGRDWMQDHRISTGCLWNGAIDRYLEGHPQIKRLVFAVDNDYLARDKNGQLRNWGQLTAAKWMKAYTEKGYACAVHVPHLNDFNTDLVEMRKGRSVEDLDRQRMAELETAFEQSAEEEPEQGMEV